jgi:Ca-activated chloride channel family protein
MQVSAKEFVDVLPEEINLGLVSFAGTATTLVTPTTDRGQVRSAIDNLELAESTAIGEAIFSSLSAIQNFQSALEAGDEDEAPARIVLLSDGYNTVGRDDTQAITAAVDAGVPVSTIAFGTDTGVVDIRGQLQRVPVDRLSLQKMAETTKGYFYEAASVTELKQVYQDMGSSIGFRVEPREVTQWYAGVALLLGLVAAGMSLLWTSRLP